MNEIARVFLALLLAGALAGCGGGGRNAERPPLAGAHIGGPFALVDQHGRTVRDSDFAGRWRIMYFGYTFCPDVCPTDVQHIAAAMKLLDKRAPAVVARVTPIFVTVDPERDTPAVLAQFTGAFDPRLVGLTGTPAAIAATAKSYGVYFRKEPATAGGGYMVSHSRAAYLMDPAGKPVALLPQDDSPEAIAAEIERWVR